VYILFICVHQFSFFDAQLFSDALKLFKCCWSSVVVLLQHERLDQMDHASCCIIAYYHFIVDHNIFFQFITLCCLRPNKNLLTQLIHSNLQFMVSASSLYITATTTGAFLVQVL